MADIKIVDLIIDLPKNSDSAKSQISNQEARRIVGGDGRANFVVLTDGQIFCKL
jgi:hypothetical protein